jgi:hypothetical protein
MPKHYQRETNRHFRDIIISSKSIKQLIVERAKKYNVSLHKLCILEKVSYRAFKEEYLEVTDAVSRPFFRQKEIIKIAKALGIDIRVQCVLDEPNEEVLKEICYATKPDPSKKSFN